MRNLRRSYRKSTLSRLLRCTLHFRNGHSRPSRFARNATYDRSCLKADIRWAPTELLLEIETPNACPMASFTMKHASLCSSIVQGGEKRRAAGMER